MNKHTRRTIQRIFSLLTPHWRVYSLICVFGLVNACLEMIPPRLIGGAVDRMGRDGFSMSPILVLAVVWVGIAIVTQILHGLQIWFANRTGERVIADLRQALFDRLQSLSMSYFDRTHPGRILTTSGNDLDSLRQIFVWGFNTLIANAAIMGLAAMMIYHTDPSLFWATAWLAPTMTILNFYYGKKVTEAWQMVRRHSSLVGANQAENIAGVRVVVAFNRQQRNLAHYNDLQETNTRNNVAAAAKSGMFQPLLQGVRFLGMAIILMYGGFRVARGQLNPGALVAGLLYWEWFMQPATQFGVFFNDLLIAFSGAERVFEILDEEPDSKDPSGEREVGRLRGHVQFENVSFRYQRSGRTVLQDVNLDIPAGTTVALVGETGGGKSSLISLLARFYQPTSGRVLIDGNDLLHIRARSLHRQMAMVLQANFLFNGTVMDNLRYTCPEASDDEIYAAARWLGCHDRFLALKDGYQTSVGERGAALSLGERQLVCFTRALVADPRILLLDEATSALDPHTGLQVQNALQRLAQGRTTFIVTHRLSTIVNVDLILVVQDGRIVERGTHAELLAFGGVYAELYANTFSLPTTRYRASL